MKTVTQVVKCLLLVQYCKGAAVIKVAMGEKCRTVGETTDGPTSGHET
jgi:hypothetical protein